MRIRVDTTRWAKGSTENCARKLNLTIWTNGLCTTQHFSWRMAHTFFWDFDIQTDNLIAARRSDLIIINKKKRKKKRNCKNVDFAVPADYKILIRDVLLWIPTHGRAKAGRPARNWSQPKRESEKKDKYLELARGLKKLWNMKVTIIPIVIGAFDTVTKGLLKVLCFDLLTRPKMPFKVTHRKEVTHSNGSYKRKSRGRKLADEMGRGKKISIILS